VPDRALCCTETAKAGKHVCATPAQPASQQGGLLQACVLLFYDTLLFEHPTLAGAFWAAASNSTHAIHKTNSSKLCVLADATCPAADLLQPLCVSYLLSCSPPRAPASTLAWPLLALATTQPACLAPSLPLPVLPTPPSQVLCLAQSAGIRVATTQRNASRAAKGCSLQRRVQLQQMSASCLQDGAARQAAAAALWWPASAYLARTVWLHPATACHLPLAR
jgi:hypothetical protein